jgi:hypothetical protein
VNESNNRGVVGARRRLIRGTFAAPAVLALHSGSAMAMTSNLRCVYNQVSTGSLSSSGNVVRTQLYGLSNGGGQTRWYLSGSDIDGLRMGKSSVYNKFLSAGQWQQFDPATAKLVGSPLNYKPTWGSGSLPTNPNGSYVAIRIDASDTEAGIVGVIDGNTPGSTVAGTCWASFVTAAR